MEEKWQPQVGRENTSDLAKGEVGAEVSSLTGGDEHLYFPLLDLFFQLCHWFLVFFQGQGHLWGYGKSTFTNESAHHVKGSPLPETHGPEDEKPRSRISQDGKIL